MYRTTLNLFRNREHAAELLFEKLKGTEWHQPLVLAIPRGGVVTGSVLAKKIGAELDVIVARKLRCPWSSELAIGAVAEGGRSFLTPLGKKISKENAEYLEQEVQHQSQEVEARVELIRLVKPKSSWQGRTIVLTDDGIATGATFSTALQVVKAENPLELIAAVPVMPHDQVQKMKQKCDRLVCLNAPFEFDAVGQFYESFATVEFEQVSALLKENQEALHEQQIMLN